MDHKVPQNASPLGLDNGNIIGPRSTDFGPIN